VLATHADFFAFDQGILERAASVISIVIVGALFVFAKIYGGNGRRDNWLTRPILSARNGRVEFFPKRWDPAYGPRPEPTPVIGHA
jgi:hypothetical protein